MTNLNARMAAFALALMLSAPCAHANGWEQFVARCLDPLTLGQGADLSGLNLVDELGEDDVDTYVDAFPDTTYWVTHSEETAEDPQQCMVMASGSVGEARASYDAWVSAQIEAGFHEKLPLEIRWTFRIAGMRGFFWHPREDFSAMVHWVSERDQEWNGETTTVYGFLITGPIAY